MTMLTADIDQAYPTPAGDVIARAEALYATGRRDLPTATVIARLDPQEDRPTWLAVRRTGIGSSDMGAVLGMSKYRSELDVWLDKAGETPLDDFTAGEAARWGNLLEDIVAREWAARHGVQVRKIGTVAHVDHRHMICDLDRLVVGCPHHKRCALEVKTRSAFKAEEWRDGQIPEDVEAQVMHQLAVTGLEAIHVAGLVGGQRLESRLVLPEADYITDLFKIGGEFWTTNVVGGVAPAISSLDLLVDHLSRLAPSKGVPVPLGDIEIREVEALTRVIIAAEQAEKEGADAKARLKALIGEDATDVEIPGDDGKPETWWTWRSQAKPKRLDREAVEAALGVPLSTFMEPTGTTRVLRKGKAVKALEGVDGE